MHHIESLKNEKQLENLVTSLITYGEDSLRQEGKREVLELQEQYGSNRKFRKVLTLVFEVFESFFLNPSFMDRLNYSFQFREFVIDKYIEWRANGKRLKELDSEEAKTNRKDKDKSMWVDLVRLYNSLSLRIEEFHVLLHKTNSFIEKYSEAKGIFGDDFLLETVKIASKFLFCQKLFKECGLLLGKVLKDKPQSPNQDYLTFEKLYEACTRASSDTQIVGEIEDVNRTIATRGLKVRTIDTEEAVFETEGKALSSNEINEKMSQFEKLSLSDQIDKADTFLLSFLLTQRKAGAYNRRCRL